MEYRWLPAVLLFVFATAVPEPARAGHEAPLYPSYYPQEIRIERVDPAAAARLLPAGKIHAYIGQTPAFAGPAPQSVRFVESLGSFLVVRLNPDSAVAKDGRSACAAAAAVVKTLGENLPAFTIHPYPVNGFHADYLQHADLAEAAKARLAGQPAPAARPKIRAATDAGADWDARVEEIELAKLLAGQSFAVNGWMGPPWLKAGWFHAYLLLASALDAPMRERAAAAVQRLQTGTFAGPEERINLERDLVGTLTQGCGATVAGYAAKREYYSADYSEGVENIAHDSHTGLNSAIFIRTVKLKDFPWNGWLRLGVPAPPAAAWNPFGGFTDAAGRLMWWALGDPGMFPEPYGGGWTLNRFGNVKPAASR